MQSVTVIQAFGDNYIYICRCSDDEAFVVDPTEAKPVLDKLEALDLKLIAVLITHHHYDHTAGVADIKKKTGCGIFTPDPARIKHTDKSVSDRDTFRLGDLDIRVIATPGHTKTSVCYHVIPHTIEQSRSAIGDESDVLDGQFLPGVFTGDTMFVAGCGRPFESTPEQLYHSLRKLVCLDGDTLVYPGHNYTAEDYEFHLSIEPDNAVVRYLLQKARSADAAGKPTVPSDIAREKSTNVFLRCHEQKIAVAMGMRNATPEEVFTALRRRKDSF